MEVKVLGAAREVGRSAFQVNCDGANLLLDYGVMFGHQPMITTIRPGILEVEYSDNILKKYFVSGGFAEVTNEKCVVLTDEAINIDDFKKNDIANKIEKIKITIENSTDRELYENQQYLRVLEDLLGSA